MGECLRSLACFCGHACLVTRNQGCVKGKGKGGEGPLLSQQKTGKGRRRHNFPFPLSSSSVASERTEILLPERKKEIVAGGKNHVGKGVLLPLLDPFPPAAKKSLCGDDRMRCVMLCACHVTFPHNHLAQKRDDAEKGVEEDGKLNIKAENGRGKFFFLLC